MVPMNVELALHSATQALLCPCCNELMEPFNKQNFEAELRVEEMKDALVIDQSLQNVGRWFEDC